ncbi:EtfB protein, partial [Klebsiella pneumoniae]|uniref:electron transfer flavoprotein subunit beta/FixA family protein n=1 Tax=Klebsiella pneumoniae TaxID=573 RepID=UPI000ED89761
EVQIVREIDGGEETIALKLPAVISADLRLNEPRFVKLPNIMAAKKKPLEKLDSADLATDISPRLKTVKFAEPKARQAGVKVASVAELVEKLKNEAKGI